MIYVNVDGKWHAEVQTADGAITTECGLEELPFGAEWTHDEPAADRCAKCFPKKKAA